MLLIPLTSSRKCMSEFILECSNFWGSKISLRMGGGGGGPRRPVYVKWGKREYS